MWSREAKYRKTEKGLMTQIYSGQKLSSRKRGHEMPQYSKKELKRWIISQKNFKELYKAWEESGYKRALKPSVDRIDDFIGYKFGNIRLITATENYRKEKKRLKGKYNYLSKIKSYYETKATLRGSFKNSCKAQSWNFEDFKETDSGEKAGTNRKYYYKTKEIK